MEEPDIRSLDIAMLRTFQTLMVEGSVSRAAERLFLSQPAVSASLKRLRAVFDDPLFTRTPHGVVPTPRALALASHVEKILQEVGNLLIAHRAFDPAQSSRIFRIVGSDHMSDVMLPPLCRLLLRQRSQIRVFWEASNFSLLADRLRKGDIDVGLLPSLARPADVEAELLYEDDYVVAGRQGHPRLQIPMSLDEFCSSPQVFLGFGRSALDDLVEQAVASRHHRRPAPQLAVTSFMQMVSVLTNSDHVAVFPRRVALRHAGRLQCQPLPFDFPRYGAYLCSSPRASADPGIQWLRQTLVSFVGVDGATH